MSQRASGQGAQEERAPTPVSPVPVRSEPEVTGGSARWKRRKTLFGKDGPPGVAVAALALLAGFIALPLVSLVFWTVSEESWEAMTSPVAIDALMLSARTTAITMVIILLVGTPAAYVLARYEFPGKRLVDSLVDIPAVLPPSAAGIALLLAFGRAGLLGEHLTAFGITISFTTAAVVMAELFVASHFYVRQASVGFAQVDRAVEESALVDGAHRLTVFLRVTVPLSFPALLAGAVTAWARALGEFGGTIIFAGNFQGVTQTIPLAIFSELERDFDAAVALSVLVLVFAFAVILTARYMTRKAHEYQE
ncbi:NifC-like ABC-type porter (plasmid) [Rubrobacter radiotolerans]|uniref:ABC transporter permease n=1 Tax=Rubrobacter radiotolerans TaxID=42256 RepID=A0A023X8G3_RUBRA|nr:ABC transporter permease [Rubrobacter radiotolerans]AHY48349.1 NifC-like ABC-type porter [Rubrobacter radiotolerans]MDX5895486.1 ABC transporter permease [Rubrobacter radiotolerans]SMC01547.1 molybdate transport system permease protein [Rubrobacter radiotolerans DSM 5868]